MLIMFVVWRQPKPHILLIRTYYHIHITNTTHYSKLAATSTRSSGSSHHHQQKPKPSKSQGHPSSNVKHSPSKRRRKNVDREGRIKYVDAMNAMLQQQQRPRSPPAIHQASKQGHPSTVEERMKRIDELILEAGVRKEALENASRCIRAGLMKGHYHGAFVDVKGEGASHQEGFLAGKKLKIDHILWQGKCEDCRASMKATVGDLLKESEDGFDWTDGCYTSAIGCPNKDCEYRCHISDVCEGRPTNDNGGGKFLKHCKFCPGFGKCIGDTYLNHCMNCHTHFNPGSYSAPCPKCGRRLNGEQDSDDDDQEDNDGDDDEDFEIDEEYAQMMLSFFDSLLKKGDAAGKK